LYELKSNKLKNKTMTTKNKGFTLVEMMVVIAVVGILAAAVLAALGPSRNKAKDTRIISGLNQVRALAETLYNPASADQYGAVTVGQTDIAKIFDDINKQNSILQISHTTLGTAYEAHAALVSDSAKAYCVDSSGFAGTVPAGQPTSGTCGSGGGEQPAGPTISTIEPGKGTKDGGTPVKITGTNFQPGAIVKFGANEVTSPTINPTEINVTTPSSQVVGAVDVIVTNPDAKGAKGTFTYE